MEQLTKAEEQVMQVLWEIKRGFVKEILAKFPDPKPAYNTVSTIIRILETKKVVSHEAKGRSHEYFPLVSKEDYRSSSLKKLMNGYFSGSLKQLVSCWVQDEQLSASELDELLKLTKENKQS